MLGIGIPREVNVTSTPGVRWGLKGQGVDECLGLVCVY